MRTISSSFCWGFLVTASLLVSSGFRHKGRANSTSAPGWADITRSEPDIFSSPSSIVASRRESGCWSREVLEEESSDAVWIFAFEFLLGWSQLTNLMSMPKSFSSSLITMISRSFGDSLVGGGDVLAFGIGWVASFLTATLLTRFGSGNSKSSSLESSPLPLVPVGMDIKTE